ncbi:unnamed protein product [Fusarium graminearum]|nr:unnamed protein product [Fusarium graminearum]
MSAKIKSTLDTLLLLWEQLDSPSKLFERESYVKLPYEDKGLGALYAQIRYQALLHWPSADL